MGAFNEWTRGTFLEKPEQREVVTVAMNLMYGEAVLTRVNILRAQGVVVQAEAERIGAMSRSAIEDILNNHDGHA